MIKIKKYRIREMLDVIIISLLYFINFGIANKENLTIVLISLGISILYSIFIVLTERNFILKVMKTPVFYWITINFIMMFIYGYFGVDKSAFSLKYHLFNYCIILNLMIIMFRNNNFINLLYQVSVITIFSLGIFIFNEEYKNLQLFLSGNFYRMGDSIVGNVNSSAMAFSFLLLPIYYVFFIKQEIKIVGIISLGIGLFLIVISGSKIAILFNIVIIIYILIKRKTFYTYVYIFLAFVLVFFNLEKLNVLFERFGDLIYDIFNFQENGSSSTNLRIRFIKTALIKFWNEPIFGHGWNSFSRLYGYVAIYKKNLYSHCNYTELLFSFGIMGFSIYYLYPIKLLFNLKKINNEAKILIKLCFLHFFIFDIASVTFYNRLSGVMLMLIIYKLKISYKNIIIVENK